LNPLCWAARRGDHAMVKAVLAFENAVVACEGPKGHTPLNCAAESGRKSCCIALVEYVRKKAVDLELDADEEVFMFTDE
jgi:ankyrin repeat protein